VTKRPRTRPSRGTKRTEDSPAKSPAFYDELLGSISQLLEQARRTSARVVNALMTATYWEIGRRIVQFEQGGKARADYGEALMERLSADLSARFGRGFSVRNVQLMKSYYLSWHEPRTETRDLGTAGILQTLSAESDGRSIDSTSSKASQFLAALARAFPLPWSAYVRLLSVKSEEARRFYEAEALRGGWSVRQLDRQIQSQFYERTALSRNKAAMLTRGARARLEDATSPEEELKDPYVLEFLGLKDEYSESDLEEALIRHLEAFLLELGGDFCFIGRQRRLRIGDEWYRVDLVFFHRRLRCLVLVDLKLGRFTHADAGQMHVYLEYAAEHWTHDGENPPVGLILCAQKNDVLARYALGNLPNKVLAAEYRTVLPDEESIAAELADTRRLLERRTPKKEKRPS
jgi:predicted nuclease of restriction endonuclease-like (RecB) superfamily